MGDLILPSLVQGGGSGRGKLPVFCLSPVFFPSQDAPTVRLLKRLICSVAHKCSSLRVLREPFFSCCANFSLSRREIPAACARTPEPWLFPRTRFPCGPYCPGRGRS